MKIEDSPFQFNPSVDKIRRNPVQSSFDFALDELDMSFLELLGSITNQAGQAQADSTSGPSDKVSEPKTPSRTESGEAKNVIRFPKPSSKVDETDEGEFNTAVDFDMVLRHDELSLLDIQYLKQEVIPALPILVGNVPFNTVFTAAANGEMSYKGFEVSPKLSELIEKGYKSGRPIRVELDANSALVLKIRNGQVSAEYVSADKAAAFVVQQELDELRNRMSARNLPVGTLEYKYQNPKQNNRKQSEGDAHNQTE